MARQLLAAAVAARAKRRPNAKGARVPASDISRSSNASHVIPSLHSRYVLQLLHAAVAPQIVPDRRQPQRRLHSSVQQGLPQPCARQCQCVPPLARCSVKRRQLLQLLDTLAQTSRGGGICGTVVHLQKRARMVRWWWRRQQQRWRQQQVTREGLAMDGEQADAATTEK